MHKITIEVDESLVCDRHVRIHGREKEVRLVRVFCGKKTIAKIDGLIFAHGFFPLPYDKGKDLGLEQISKTAVFFLPSEPVEQFGRRILIHRVPGVMDPESWYEVEVGRSDKNVIPDGSYVAVYKSI